MLPLWLGMVPFGAAYAVSARAAGLSLFETQLMSLVVFSGGAQFSAAGLFAANASPFTLVATTFLINARHLLYGVSLGQLMPVTWRQRFLVAHLLTDEAYGVTFGSPARSLGFFLGAGSSLFFIWNLSTLVGALLSRLVPTGGLGHRLHLPAGVSRAADAAAEGLACPYCRGLCWTVGASSLAGRERRAGRPAGGRSRAAFGAYLTRGRAE
jgi:predicted branched-subunit amino acid permease